MVSARREPVSQAVAKWAASFPSTIYSELALRSIQAELLLT